ncbi:Superoxide dismutase [Fe] 2, chloroplastic [Dionaea muscipula]
MSATALSAYLSSTLLLRHPHGLHEASNSLYPCQWRRKQIRKVGAVVTAKVDLKPPPYPLDALEPHMSKETLEYHWGKHHRGYVENLNKQIVETDLDERSLEDIIRISYNQGNLLPTFNNAAQIWNHEFFWESIRPSGGGKPSGELLRLLERDFGSYEAFAQEFKSAAATQFGSGWAWLAYKTSKLDVGNAVNPRPSEQDKKLVVVKSPNAVNPLVWNYYYPLLTIDVWEHAYYLDFQNRRADYISIFLEKLVSWESVSTRLERAITQLAEIETEEENKRLKAEEESDGDNDADDSRDE